jgi:hypothetical protein
MSNLFVITGARNSGKSFCAATYLKPSEISGAFVHDSEKSMNRVVERLAKSNLSFGHYADLSARFKDLPGDDDLLDRINKGHLPWVDNAQRSSLVAYYEYLLNDLATNLTKGDYTLYIHDTIEKLEAGMAAWVEDHKRESGVKRTAYGGLWTQGVYPLYEHLAASIFGRGVETIIFTSHLKTPWEGKQPVVGKVAPAGKKILYRLSSLFLWLVSDRRNQDGAPAGLVLKERLGDIVPVNDEWVIKRMLPERIPHCTWKDINTYLQDGCDLANPAEGEVMSVSERDMISELISDEQMRLMILGGEKELAEMQAGMLSNVVNGNGGNDFDIQAAIENREEAVDTAKTLKEQAREMAEGGMDAAQIAEMLERPLPIIRAILKNGS